ncbi:MAG TPA: hypothetical protein VFN56_02630 [Candidatus Saccharimonadales bacterium]|nr:hypothetical protein [Candidatus Saccharimonadales bacterium]
MEGSELPPNEAERVMYYVSHFADACIAAHADDRALREAYHKFLFGLVLYAAETRLEPALEWAPRSNDALPINTLHDEQLGAAADRSQQPITVLGSLYPSRYNGAQWRGILRTLAASVVYNNGNNVSSGAMESSELLAAINDGTIVFNLKSDQRQ